MEATYHPSYCRFLFIFPFFYFAQLSSLSSDPCREAIYYRFCDATTMQVRLNLNLCCVEFVLLLFLQ